MAEHSKIDKLLLNFEGLYPGMRDWFWESVINSGNDRVFLQFIEQDKFLGWLILKPI